MVSLDFSRGTRDVVVKIGNQMFTSKDCVLIDLNLSGMNFENDLPILDGNITSIPMAKDFTLDLSFKFTEFEMEYGIFNIKTKNIKDKIVGDCSVGELLHAISIKLKREK